MKQSNNNEVDLLLRALARGERDTSRSAKSMDSAPRNWVTPDHLDADELNSFAEGVLTSAARARYTEHLADCERCRRIIVGLTQAAGAASPNQGFEQERGPGFWRQLAAFFSPQVLRYSVPVLVLTAAIAIGLLALRQQRSRQFVAQNQPAASSSPIDALEQSESSVTQSKSDQPAMLKDGIESPSNINLNNEKLNSQDDKGRLDQAPVGNAGDKATSDLSAKDSVKPGQAVGAVEAQPSFAPEPKAAAPPPPTVTLTEAEKTSVARNQQPAEQDAQQRKREENYQVRDEAATHGPSRTAAARAGSRRNEGLVEPRGGPRKEKKETAGEAETRTISGRQFVRDGNAWVDRAYDSSRATINVARRSEQFRALVADEPGIRAIAEQLGGEVIVVWKGKAYRIR